MMRSASIVRSLFLQGSRAEALKNVKIAQPIACLSTSATCFKPLDTDYPPNSSIIPTFVNNRNPRNLEKLRIGEKPSGWRFEKESRSYWNKITLQISNKHVSAAVVHYLGQRAVTASTKEWCIKKFLYSTNDASAAKLVGEVIARRCLQTGIVEVACLFPKEDREKEKVSLFLKAVEEGGVALSEPTQAEPEFDLHDKKLPERPWEVFEDVNDSFTIAGKLRERVERGPRKRVKLAKAFKWQNPPGRETWPKRTYKRKP